MSRAKKDLPLAEVEKVKDKLNEQIGVIHSRFGAKCNSGCQRQRIRSR